MMSLVGQINFFNNLEVEKSFITLTIELIWKQDKVTSFLKHPS